MCAPTQIILSGSQDTLCISGKSRIPKEFWNQKNEKFLHHQVYDSGMSSLFSSCYKDTDLEHVRHHRIPLEAVQNREWHERLLPHLHFALPQVCNPTSKSSSLASFNVASSTEGVST